jgi:hypothetical protein
MVVVDKGRVQVGLPNEFRQVNTAKVASTAKARKILAHKKGADADWNSTKDGLWTYN